MSRENYIWTDANVYIVSLQHLATAQQFIYCLGVNNNNKQAGIGPSKQQQRNKHGINIYKDFFF